MTYRYIDCVFMLCYYPSVVWSGHNNPGFLTYVVWSGHNNPVSLIYSVFNHVYDRLLPSIFISVYSLGGV